jgi:hypothetical protein
VFEVIDIADVQGLEFFDGLIEGELIISEIGQLFIEFIWICSEEAK